jgi:hypothetical protein
LNFGSEWLIEQSEVGLLVEISNSMVFNGFQWRFFTANS